MIKKIIKMINILILLLIVVINYSSNVYCAHYPLQVINIKPVGDGTPPIGSSNRIFRAYPGIEYNIRVAVTGGSYPYMFSLKNAPNGMTINDSTGEISWANPQNDESNISVEVIDSEGSTITSHWSIDVTTSGFIFVDDNAPLGGDGTINKPLRDINDVLNLGSSFRDHIVYFRAGTYNTPNYYGHLTEWLSGGNKGCYLGYDGGRAYKWIGYPNETVTINMNDTFLDLTGGSLHDAYFDSLRFTNATCGIIAIPGNYNYFTFRRCVVNDLVAGSEYNGNYGAIYFTGHTGPGYYKVFQDNIIRNLTNSAGFGSLYWSSMVLIEDNEIYNLYGDNRSCGIVPKENVDYLTIRHNKFYNLNGHSAFGNTLNSHFNTCDDIEICFNLIMAGNDSDYSTRYNYHSCQGRTYIYRNTIVGRVEFAYLDYLGAHANATKDNGPFTVYNNVIINDYLSNWPTTNSYMSCGTCGSNTDDEINIPNGNLVGESTDEIIDAKGHLTNLSFIGIYGWQVTESDNLPPNAPTGIAITAE